MSRCEDILYNKDGKLLSNQTTVIVEITITTKLILAAEHTTSPVVLDSGATPSFLRNRTFVKALRPSPVFRFADGATAQTRGQGPVVIRHVTGQLQLSNAIHAAFMRNLLSVRPGRKSRRPVSKRTSIRAYQGPSSIYRQSPCIHHFSDYMRLTCDLQCWRLGQEFPFCCHHTRSHTIGIASWAMRLQQ
jgi:hypothetical protein